MAEFKVELSTLATSVQNFLNEKKLNFDESGTAIYDDGVYIEAAEKVAGINEETLKKVREFDEAFAAGTIASTGKQSIDWFVQSKDNTQTKIVIPMTGQDKAVVSFNRTTSTMNPETREPDISFGDAVFAYHYNSGSAENSDFAVAIKAVSSYAAEMLKDL